MKQFTFGLLILLLAASGIYCQEAESPKRVTVPKESALKAATELLESAYSKQLARATTSAAKAELAVELVEASVEAARPANKYVMISRALELATEAGNAEIAFDIQQQLFTNFVMDNHDQRMELIKDLYKNADKVQMWSLGSKCLEFAEDAVEKDDYEMVGAFFKYAGYAAKKSGDKELVNDVKDRKRLVRLLEDRFKEVASALEEIKKNPQDTKANETVAEFYCLLKDDWEKGLPYMAKSGQEPHASLATIELSNLKEPQQQYDLAESWWALSKNVGKLGKENVMAHAVFWYRKALEDLPGLKKKIAETRIETYEKTATRANKMLVLRPGQKKGWDLPKTKIKSTPTGFVVRTGDDISADISAEILVAVDNQQIRHSPLFNYTINL